MSTQTTTLRAGIRSTGISPGIPALIYFALFAIAIAFNLITTSAAPFPTPYDPVSRAQDYYGTYGETLRVYSILIVLSALPLGIFTALVCRKLNDLTIDSVWISVASFGGYSASIFLAMSGLCTWTLTQPEITQDAAVTKGILLFGFAAGGTGSVVFSSLLIGSISSLAIAGNLLPGWVRWFGVIIATISFLSVINMAMPAASVMLPIGRFIGMIWMVIAGFSLRMRNGT